MKVFCSGKEVFEIDTTEPIPDFVEIDENTGWGDKWFVFALCNLLSGNAKLKEGNIEALKSMSNKDKTAE